MCRAPLQPRSAPRRHPLQDVPALAQTLLPLLLICLLAILLLLASSMSRRKTKRE